MEPVFIAVALLGLLTFPMIAYGVMWFTSRDRTGDRPEPPQTNRNRRTIPGGGSDR
jgi:hypothetical protein